MGVLWGGKRAGGTWAPPHGKVQAKASLLLELCQQPCLDKTLVEASKPQQANCN